METIEVNGAIKYGLKMYQNGVYSQQHYNQPQQYNQPASLPNLNYPAPTANMQNTQTTQNVTIIRQVEAKTSSYLVRWRLFVAEFFGTLLLVLLICMGCAFNLSLTVLQICMLNGLVVTAVIHIFGPISGAHVNPAVTLAHWIINQAPILDILTYVVAQILGATVGYALIFAMKPDGYELPEGHCVTQLVTIPSDSFYDDEIAVLTGQGVFIEAVLTFVLVLAVCSTWDNENQKWKDSISLRIGFIVTVLNLAGIYYTGASLNPARSFGPALGQDHWDHHWVYWVGPLSGSVVASLLYKYVLGRRSND